jgi:hypothetical protein
MADRLKQLAALLMPSGTPAAPMGSGMVQQAAQSMQSRPYQLHVQEAQANGQQPMTPEQFMAQQRPAQ